MEYTYTLNEFPGSLARSGFMPYQAGADQKKALIRYQISLGDQHDGKPFLKGPLLMNIIFYMPIPKNKPIELYDGMLSTAKPPICELEQFIQQAAMGVLYANACSIVSVVKHKICDKNPRIVFTLREIDGK